MAKWFILAHHGLYYVLCVVMLHVDTMSAHFIVHNLIYLHVPCLYVIVFTDLSLVLLHRQRLVLLQPSLTTFWQ